MWTCFLQVAFMGNFKEFISSDLEFREESIEIVLRILGNIIIQVQKIIMLLTLPALKYLLC